MTGFDSDCRVGNCASSRVPCDQQWVHQSIGQVIVKTCNFHQLVYNLVYTPAETIMKQFQTIGTYETKTHLADVLRRVRLGEGFTITQRGEPVADLVPAGSGARRSSTAAAQRMRRFMQDAPEHIVDPLIDTPVNLKELIDAGRD
jgi:prevent-host-death family protein